jgi:hypothetical protein
VQWLGWGCDQGGATGAHADDAGARGAVFIGRPRTTAIIITVEDEEISHPRRPRRTYPSAGPSARIAGSGIAFRPRGALTNRGGGGSFILSALALISVLPIPLHEYSRARLMTWRLTQKPTSHGHRQPLTAFETHNGHSTFGAGTALLAPEPSFAITPLNCRVGWFSAVHSLSLNIPWAVALSQVGAMPRQVSGTFPQTRRASSLGQWFGDQSRSPRKNSPIRNPGCRSRTRTAVGH